MFDVSVIGLGKLGMPTAVAIANKYKRPGKVRGYDINKDLMKRRKYEHKELGPDLEDNFQEILDEVTKPNGRDLPFLDLDIYDLRDVVETAEIIFVCVQTPHDPKLDGSLPFDFKHKRDFDYSYLTKACKDIAPFVSRDQTVAIVSTVLPGTIRREILPIFKDKCSLVYNPQFISMGQVMYDFYNPEFVLMGYEKPEDTFQLEDFYDDFYNDEEDFVDTLAMSYESAELAKLSYNTFITAKITIANNIMEMAHYIPYCDCDAVSEVLINGTKRITSGRYLRGGGGEGGNCHPRDCLSLSWFSDYLGISSNIFDGLMCARDRQCEWLISLIEQHSQGLPIVLLGKAFKEGTNITAGSAAILCANLLKERNIKFVHIDPIVDVNLPDFPVPDLEDRPQAFLILTKHPEFAEWRYPPGSVVVDPFRYIPEQIDVRLIKVGVGPRELLS